MKRNQLFRISVTGSILILLATLILFLAAACSGNNGNGGTASTGKSTSSGSPAASVTPAASKAASVKASASAAASPGGSTATTGGALPVTGGDALKTALENFSYTYVPILENGTEGEPVTFMRTKDAMKMISGEAMILFDYANRKMYTLDNVSKIAFEMAYEEGAQHDPFTGFAYVTGDTLAGYAGWGFTKKATETVDGQACALYEGRTDAAGNLTVQVWLREQDGIMVKYLSRQDGNITGGVYMKNLKIGNVTTQDVSLPAGYQVMSVDSLLDQLNNGN